MLRGFISKIVWFGVLTAERPYKKAWPEKEAFSFIALEAGNNFDPELIVLFLGIREEILRI